jgi:TP901 family phage tail tape measure protein
MSDVIEFNDIFADDAFSKGLQGVEALTNGFKEMAVQLGKVAAEQKEFLQGLKINNSDDIKKLTSELQKAQKTIVDLNNANAASKQGEIELAKLRQANAKALQEEEKAQQQKLRTEKAANQNKEKTLTLYQQESKLLRDLKNEYKNVALAQGQTSKAAQDLLAKITPLDAKLKQLDKTTGDNFRNVGNYKSALEGAGGAIKNILGAAGLTVGLSAGFDLLKDSVNEFAKLESSLKNLQAITGVSSEELEFFQKNAEELGISVKGGAVAVVEAYKLIGSAKPELLENKDALNEVTKAAILLSQAAGLELPEAATRLTDALNQYGASADQAGKFTDVLAAGAKFGAAEVPQITDALLKFGVAAKSSNISIQESVGAIELLAEKGLKGAEAGTNLRNVFAKLSAAKALPTEAIKQLEKAGVNIDKLSDNSLSLNERLKELSKIQGDAVAITKVFGLENKTAGEILISNLPRLEELTKAVDSNGAALEQAAINTDTFAFKQQRLENTLTQLKVAIGAYIVDAGNQLIDFYDNVTGKVSRFDLVLKQLQGSFTKQAQEIVKYNLQQKAYEELQKKAIEVTQDATLTTQERTEKLAIITKQVNALTNEILKNKKPIEDNTAATDDNTVAITKNTKAKKENRKEDKSREDDSKKRKQEADDLKTFDETRRKIDFNEKDERQKLEDDKKRLAEEEKKRREDDLKDLFDTTSKALQIAEQEIKRKEKLREDAIDKEIDDRQRSIDEQKRRAEQGLSNTLAFEEQALREAEARKAEEEKKAVKREKTISFFKLLSANAEKDPANALQKTLTEILLAEAISGAFFKGTEKVSDDLQGNKVHNGRDGYVVAVDGSERVLTGEQNKLIGNMSNEDLAKLAHDYKNNKLLPNYMLNEGVNTSVSENIYASMQLSQMVKMNERLESLEQAIKNKPVSNVNIDNLGNIIKQEIKNGLLITTKKPLTRGY